MKTHPGELYVSRDQQIFIFVVGCIYNKVLLLRTSASSFSLFSTQETFCFVDFDYTFREVHCIKKIVG